MQVNEEKRKKFMEYAGKRVNNVLHDIQILEPMSRSTSYDFTRQDVEEMFNAMQETLNNTKAEFVRKFEEKARSEKKVFSFGTTTTAETTNTESYAVADTTAPTVENMATATTDTDATIVTESYSEASTTTAETGAEIF